MDRYIAVIDYAEEMFGAYFPDAPGCTAMGETELEVIDNAGEALAEWAADERANGRALPKPRSYLQLLEAGEYGLGTGGLIATVALFSDTGKLSRANISIDAGLLAAIDETAHRQGVTRSAFLAAAARERIKAAG